MSPKDDFTRAFSQFYFSKIIFFNSLKYNFKLNTFVKIFQFCFKFKNYSFNFISYFIVFTLISIGIGIINRPCLCNKIVQYKYIGKY